MKLRQDLASVLPRLSDADVHRFCLFYRKYAPHLARIAGGLYDRLPASDQARFLVWFLKRWAKIDLVNEVERGLYAGVVERARREDRPSLQLHGRSYRVRDFGWQGFDFQLLGYDWFLGVHDVLYDQYEHGPVALQPDDVIIDAGAFIGDTAVFFHHKLGGRCRIHSFELLDENLALLLHNLERNGVPDDRIVLNKLALADTTGGEIVVADGSSQGATSIFGRPGRGDRVQTITLDEYVIRSNLDRVDFIKMDIEGAEALALAGARQTIRHFRPRLAICLYHKWDDVFTIPQLIHDTGVAYEFGFKWVQLTDGWEAVLLARPADPDAPSVSRAPAHEASSPDPLADTLDVLTRACARGQAQVDTLSAPGRAARVAAGPDGPAVPAFGQA